MSARVWYINDRILRESLQRAYILGKSSFPSFAIPLLRKEYPALCLTINNQNLMNQKVFFHNTNIFYPSKRLERKLLREENSSHLAKTRRKKKDIEIYPLSGHMNHREATRELARRQAACFNARAPTATISDHRALLL